MDPKAIILKADRVKQEGKRKEETPAKDMNGNNDKQVYFICLFKTKQRI